MSAAVLNQGFQCDDVPPEMMDRLWAAGWRHFGTYFFRYSASMDESAVLDIQPLRVDLQKFSLTKSQRRVLRRNADLRCEFQPAALTEEARAMFHRHKGRFKDNVPDELDTFLSPSPATVPCECLECRVYAGSELIALSFLDIGADGTSAVYGLFEPAHAERGLGTYTMLKEIELSQQRGCRYYYPGYASRQPSAYDYKKRLPALETLDWHTGEWGPMERLKQEEKPAAPLDEDERRLECEGTGLSSSASPLI